MTTHWTSEGRRSRFLPVPEPHPEQPTTTVPEAEAAPVDVARAAWDGRLSEHLAAGRPLPAPGPGPRRPAGPTPLGEVLRRNLGRLR